AAGGRIWLKGSSSCRSARIDGVAEPVALDPPYYVAIVEAPVGDRSVTFVGEDGPIRVVTVRVPDGARLDTRAPFSALFFGDFQPFVIDDGRVRVNAGEEFASADGRDDAHPPHTLVATRKLFELAACGKLPFPAPSYACGVGDQVYVEGDYHAWDRYGQQHPMSAWSVEAQPRPRVGVAALPGFLDRCYRGHWSFPVFERALQVCPALMTWDDHDIRDGWGSHGDEHVYRDSFFRVFRDAYVAHQYRRGPRLWTPEQQPIDAPLWQSFTVHGVPTFVLDLRTCRDVAVPTVMGDAQWRELRAWFASLDPQRSKHYVLVASVPLFFRVGERAKIAAAFGDEVRDDLLDTWTSSVNEGEWRQLVQEIASAGARGLRGLIVSGDYHVNALCRVTATRAGGSPEVIAYEMIASGLANDSYGDWKQKMARKGWFLETPIELPDSDLHTEFSFAEPCPSFGGLQFDGEAITAHMFQATGDGLFQMRVPLTWSTTGAAWRAMVAGARTRIDDRLLR
ncbi:MAG: alkaline phosphatase D family protein, partial [Planctomycetota bacterium]